MIPGWHFIKDYNYILKIAFMYMPIGGTFLKANVPCTDLSEDSLINDLLSVVSSGFPLKCLIIHTCCIIIMISLAGLCQRPKFVVIYGVYIYSMPIEL